MKIAFYAPLKSPNHPVPSGDRLMARQLIQALRQGRHEVDIASEFRSFSAKPDALADLQARASHEIRRLDAEWLAGGRPDVWFCYHPYYKSPDLLGPELCRRHGVGYVTVEASYSAKRNGQGWREHQTIVADALRLAAVNLCLTRRDLDGIRQSMPDANLRHLPPFIDTSAFADLVPLPKPFHLATVAMMRAGDKMSSYSALAAGLQRIDDLPWTLSIIGDGPCRSEVEALFSGCRPDRIVWHGQLGTEAIAACLATAALYLWPGHGEAYGLAYLEAQAAGLPVVAENTAGVPEVVANDRTGVLTLPGDADLYAAAVSRLLSDEGKRCQMALEARKFVLEERSLERAARHMNTILAAYLEESP